MNAERPASLPAARGGAPDDLTLIDGVSLLQHSTLNSLGIYHFDQIAAWSPGNVAWVDHYLRLRGRIVDEDWVTQAQALARGEGIALSERMPDELATEDEPA
jgi:NADH-quinone oxidoreductase subunit E